MFGFSAPGFQWAAMSAINRERAARWHPGYPDDQGWTGGDWGNALAGEVGELCNVVKKLRRHEARHSTSYNTPEVETLRASLVEEAADVMLYLDLLLGKYDITPGDLSVGLVEKFNRVSDAQGWDDLHLTIEELS
jgi:NTP pyrophosphatase (non-canonical NTP hydrolase)